MGLEQSIVLTDLLIGVLWSATVPSVKHVCLSLTRRTSFPLNTFQQSLTTMPSLSCESTRPSKLPRAFLAYSLLIRAVAQDRGRAVHIRPFRYCRTGRLRSAAATLIPTNRRFPRLLLSHITRILRKRTGEVVSRGAPPLPRRPMPDCGHTNRFEG